MPHQLTLTAFNDDPTEQVIDPIPLAKDGTPSEEWIGFVHPDGFLELTRGFYLYAGKLSRVLHFLANDRTEERPVYDQLVEATGMSSAQVEAYVQHAAAMQLLVPRRLVPTPLGNAILHLDPFFDQAGTLWLLHYLIASNPQVVVWNYMCNAVLPTVERTTLAHARDQFLPFMGRWSEASIHTKVRKELGAFFADYTAEFFVALDYLRQEGESVYIVNRNVMPVPPLILLATVLVFRDRFMPGASSVEIPALAYEEHSPGRILRQNELNLRRGLDELHEQDWLTVEAKANLDQVRFRREVTWLHAARAYWEVTS